MAENMEIKKTELVWRGKYTEEGKIQAVDKPGPYPFQIVETVNSPRIEGKAEKLEELFTTYEGKEGNTFEGMAE